MKYLSLASLFLLVLTCCTSKKVTYVTIGTGGVTGVYYPIGGAVAKLVNNLSGVEKPVKVSVESTAGSIYNINAVLSGDLQFGIAQADKQFQAIHGLNEWEGKPQPSLRAVVSFHPEVVTLVAAEDSTIRSLKDLKGKRVNLGSAGSGQRGNAQDILTAAGFNLDKDLHAEALQPAEAPKMLQDERIDAFFYTVGHPNGAITESTAGRRKVRLVSITGMDDLIKKFPFYTMATIPRKLYPSAVNTEDVKSIGVRATLITTEKIPEDVVYLMTKTIVENLDTFKSLHPAFQQFTREDFVGGMTAPLHPGALKYFKEIGLQ